MQAPTRNKGEVKPPGGLHPRGRPPARLLLRGARAPQGLHRPLPPRGPRAPLRAAPPGAV